MAGFTPRSFYSRKAREELEFIRGGSDSEDTVLDDSDADHDYIQPSDSEESDENIVEEEGLLPEREDAESSQPASTPIAGTP